MEAEQAALKILDTMLGHLDFPVRIEIESTRDGACLQILTTEHRHLIGKDGERLDDLQYLVNRILKRHLPEAPRVKVDCEHFRAIQEDQLIEEIRAIAERVKLSGKPVQVRPLNAYYRRLVHHALVDDAAVKSVSPGGEDRLKRITIKPRQSS